jgi:hypothetical protein
MVRPVAFVPLPRVLNHSTRVVATDMFIIRGHRLTCTPMLATLCTQSPILCWSFLHKTYTGDAGGDVLCLRLCGNADQSRSSVPQLCDCLFDFNVYFEPQGQLRLDLADSLRMGPKRSRPAAVACYCQLSGCLIINYEAEM